MSWTNDYRNIEHISEKYFAPILPDLKKHFAQLPPKDLYRLIDDYGKKYGFNAYNYALKVCLDWQQGRVRMSEQTLLRLVETLPHYMKHEERINLFTKLYNHHIKNMPQYYIEERATWDNYRTALDECYSKIYKRYTSYFAPCNFSPNVLKLASWLTNKDLDFARDFIAKRFIESHNALTLKAYNDIENFKKECDVLYQQGLVYESKQLIINLLTIKIIFNILAKEKPKPKSWLSKLLDF
ncbi:MAG: hypothetical protein IKT51_02725 [Phascolarctobacterium sp.]|nr:hypothetical protein [Phascolarctobacterium sp.]